MSASELPVDFVVGCPRSGTTLLGLLLDAHADIFCPGEYQFSNLIEALRDGGLQMTFPAGEFEAGDTSTELVDRAARSLVFDFVRPHLHREGKRRWVQKECTADLKLLRQVFPQSRFVFIHRHCQDVVESALVAKKYGGLRWAPSPGLMVVNPAEAFADAWARLNERLIAYAEQEPDGVICIHYEDLVRDPATVMRSIFQFLGAKDDPAATKDVFRKRHVGFGGDPNAPYQKSVHESSIGKGAHMPLGRFSKETVDKVNGVLSRLKYPLLGEWRGSAIAPAEAA